MWLALAAAAGRLSAAANANAAASATGASATAPTAGSSAVAGSSAAVGSSAAATAVASPATQSKTEIPWPEILFHADLDGRFASPACGKSARPSPDYAALVAALSDARAAAAARGEPTPVTLLGGNWAAPDPFAAAVLRSGVSGPRALAALLARGGYDAIAIGHDELSLDPATLDALLPGLAATGLPLLASNLTCDARRPACFAIRREILIRRPGTTIGVLATISPSVLAGIPAGRMAGFGLTDPLTAIRAGLTRLRAQGANEIIVLTDGPHDVRALDELDDLARKLAGGAAPDLLLGAGLADDDRGRTVRLLRRDGSPPVIGSPVGTAGLSVVRIAGGQVGAGVGIDVDAVAAAANRTDATTEKLLTITAGTYCAHAAEPLAPIRGSLTRDDFVKYVLEVMRRRAGAEIALVNQAFVKHAPFPITGTFTRGDLERALPYGAVIGAARVQGPVVDSLLGPALGNPKLAVVGLGHGAGGVEVNGRPLDKSREYRVATISFVAGGGDGIFAPHALPFTPLPGDPDLRAEVEDFLRGQTAAEDHDPTVNLATDFGRPAVDRPLLVLLGDGEFDLAGTSISNAAAYGDAQLTRAQQTSIKGEATLVAQIRHPVHVVDGRFDAQYGWARSQPPDMPAVSGESVDLITGIVTYTYRGLRDWRRVPKPAIPDPYARVWLESEFTRPDVTSTQSRTYHHLQLTNTAGAQLTLTPKLKVRGGAGAQSELLAPGDEGGGWHAVLEAGATLDPTAIATWGALAVKLEGLIDYDLVDPTETRQHQLRATGKLSVPLVPSLFITIGVDVFAVQRQKAGWAESYDTTIGLRVHTDFAHQAL
ncbi:MAG TPA: 5'-nucleotidase C-terminal domain-containing protein [Polyangia bacterium]|nr:5'-nucleotidase C-terminal domain-containing protein [Polyangia bacterium]